MKIVEKDPIVVYVTKIGTKVGELYAINDGKAINLRCQGGFVNMQSGAYSGYEVVRDDACWIHLPDAELHLNR